MNKFKTFVKLFSLMILISLGNTSYANIENGSFEGYEMIKDNKSWKIVKMDNWKSIEVPKIDKNSIVDFSKYEEVGTEIWENKGRYTRYGTHQIELDSYGTRAGDTHIDAIYQEFDLKEDKTLIFNSYARQTNSSDIELYIDGKYVETITPSKKYSTHFYDLKSGTKSIMFKEVDSQDNGAGAVIDGVKVVSEGEMRKIVPYENGISIKAVKVITNDKGLAANTTYDDIYDGAEFANEMGNLIYTEIKKLGLMDDAKFDIEELKAFNTHMFENHHEEMKKLHGDDEKGEETGFHLVQNDGATTKLNVPGIKNEKNAVNTIGDGIFHFGLYASVNDKRILNEDGNKNQTWADLAKYMNFCLNDELKAIKDILEKEVGMSVKLGEFIGYENKTITGENIKSTGVAIFKNKTLSTHSEIEFVMNTTKDGGYQNGFLVFDYKDEKNFKYAGSRDGANYWTVGEVINGKYKDKAKKKENIDSNKGYNIKTIVNGGSIDFLVNGESKVKYDFKSNFNDTVGYAVEKAITKFSNIEIRNLGLIKISGTNGFGGGDL